MDAAFAEESPAAPAAVTAATAVRGTVFGVLFAISFAHLLNDTIQALIPALYPLLKQNFGFSFTQIGIITFTFQCTASLPAAGGRFCHGQTADALVAGDRHGLYADRAAAAFAGAQLPDDRPQRGAGRDGLGGLPIRKPRVWRIWPRAGSAGSRNRFSR